MIKLLLKPLEFKRSNLDHFDFREKFRYTISWYVWCDIIPLIAVFQFLNPQNNHQNKIFKKDVTRLGAWRIDCNKLLINDLHRFRSTNT